MGNVLRKCSYNDSSIKSNITNDNQRQNINTNEQNNNQRNDSYTQSYNIIRKSFQDGNNQNQNNIQNNYNNNINQNNNIIIEESQDIRMYQQNNNNGNMNDLNGNIYNDNGITNYGNSNTNNGNTNNSNGKMKNNGVQINNPNSNTKNINGNRNLANKNDQINNGNMNTPQTQMKQQIPTIKVDDQDYKFEIYKLFNGQIETTIDYVRSDFELNHLINNIKIYFDDFTAIYYFNKEQQLQQLDYTKRIKEDDKVKSILDVIYKSTKIEDNTKIQLMIFDGKPSKLNKPILKLEQELSLSSSQQQYQLIQYNKVNNLSYIQLMDMFKSNDDNNNFTFDFTVIENIIKNKMKEQKCFYIIIHPLYNIPHHITIESLKQHISSSFNLFKSNTSNNLTHDIYIGTEYQVEETGYIYIQIWIEFIKRD